MATTSNPAPGILKRVAAAFALSCVLFLAPQANAGWHGGWGCCGWGWGGGVSFAFAWPGYYPYYPYPYYPAYSYAPPYSYTPPYSYAPNYSYYPPAPSQPSVPPPPPQQSFVVLFPFDQSILTADATGVLDQVAEQARQGGAVQIEVSGYTDSPGTSDYNMALSQRRAEAVRQYLTARGVSESQIVARGFGKEYPRVPTPEGVQEAQNRRVEITIRPSSNVAYGQTGSDCQPVQTTITVNGQQEPAYGQACRQADGSWKFMP